jgi:hypothetical protein
VLPQHIWYLESYSTPLQFFNHTFGVGAGVTTVSLFPLTHPAAIIAVTKTIKRRYFIPVPFIGVMIYFSYLGGTPIRSYSRSVGR